MRPHRFGAGKALRLVHRRPEGQRHDRSHPGHRHQPTAQLVIADLVENHFVQLRELLAHDPSHREQGDDNHLQRRLPGHQLLDPGLEVPRADHPTLSPKLRNVPRSSFSMSCSLSRSSLRLVSNMRACWLARVFTCTGLYSPTRIICAIPRASLRSLLFTCCAFRTAFMWRVSTQMTGSSAFANPFTSHCDNGPASSPIRAYSRPAPFKKPMMASGSVATL